MIYTNEEWQAMSTAQRVKIRRQQVAIRRKATYWEITRFIGYGLAVYAALYGLAC